MRDGGMRPVSALIIAALLVAFFMNGGSGYITDLYNYFKEGFEASQSSNDMSDESTSSKSEGSIDSENAGCEMSDTTATDPVEGQVLSCDVQETVAALKVAEYSGDYNRDEWTSSSQRYEFQGQKYNSIRKYDQVSSIFATSGGFISPYTGEVLPLESAQFDHIVSLHKVSQGGGYAWTTEQKRAFADDNTIGVNVEGSLNMGKSDQGPSEWLPPANRVSFCYTYAKIVVDHNLTVNQADRDALVSCVGDSTGAYDMTQKH